MKKYLLGFALIAAFTATGYSDPDAFKDFTYKDMQMGFSMPAEPVASTQSVDTRVGPLVIHMYLLDKGQSAMLVGVNDYPPGSVSTDPEKAIEGARDGSMASMKCTVTTQKKITLDNNPGLEFEFEGDTVHGTYRIYLVGTRLYQIASFAAKGQPLLDGTDKFFASFHLLKP